MAIRSPIPLRWLISGFLLAGAALLNYHKRVGMADAEGISVLRLLLRPDLWFGAAVGLGMIGMTWQCLKPVRGFRPAAVVLRGAPWLAFGTALAGTLAGWYWHGEVMNKFGAQDSIRFLLSAPLGIMVYNLAVCRAKFASSLAWIFRVVPVIHVALAGVFLLSPSLVATVFGSEMLVEGDGLFSLGARYQGLTSNPNMVASSSLFAFAMLLPGLQHDLRMRSLAGLIKGVYAVGLVGVIVWSGVRAVVLLLVLVSLISLWLSLRPTKRSIAMLIYTSVALGAVAVIGSVVLWQAGIVGVLAERFEGGDGRIFLWKHYLGVLWHNPIGLGFGFESIIKTDEILSGQRLPPHNTVLQMAMYGGVAGVLVHWAVLVAMARAILRARQAYHLAPLPRSIQSLVLAWLACVTNLCFAGLIFTDYAYVLLSALLLVELRLDWERRSMAATTISPSLSAR